jgi:hypothetical protein
MLVHQRVALFLDKQSWLYAFKDPISY